MSEDVLAISNELLAAATMSIEPVVRYNAFKPCALFIWATTITAQSSSFAILIRELNCGRTSLDIFKDTLPPIYDDNGSRISSFAFSWTTALYSLSSENVRGCSASFINTSLFTSPPAFINLGSTVSSASSSEF